MPFELYIALRYLKSSRKGRLLSGVSLIAIAGMIIGVLALVIALSVMNGYESEVRSNFIGVFAHGRVRAYLDRGVSKPDELLKILQDYDQIKAMTPYINDKGLIMTSEDQTGIIIRGVQCSGFHDGTTELPIIHTLAFTPPKAG